MAFLKISIICPFFKIFAHKPLYKNRDFIFFMNNKLKFIDLFAGIGGFHLALHALGMECVFASEIDKHARQTYRANFQDISPQLFENNDQFFNEDITKIDPSEIPDFDILCGGFPCQPFSNAGHKKGFDDTRGTLFFNIAEIIRIKQPQVVFLENVRGLLNHDKGKTFGTIYRVLEELGYSVSYKVVFASDYGLPQMRPRLYIICFKDTKIEFEFPPKIPLKYNMSDVWEGKCSREIGFTLRCGGRGSPISDRRNWDAYLVDGQVRQLMAREAKKMQGFPDGFEFPVSNTQSMKQLGNSVAVDAVRKVAKQIQQCLSKKLVFVPQVIQEKLFNYESK